MDHAILLTQLTAAGVDPRTRDLVREYLSLPDAAATGRGMVAGGATSPLLGAVYLTPLDRTQTSRNRRKTTQIFGQFPPERRL